MKKSVKALIVLTLASSFLFAAASPLPARERREESLRTESLSPYGPEGRRWGAGLAFGEPSGVTLKGYVSRRFAIDGTFGWSFFEEAFTVLADVTYDIFEIPVDSRSVTLPFYAGAGGKIAFDRGGKNSGDTTGALRVPVGLAIQWANHPAELFFEIGPGVGFGDQTHFDLTGGVGGRFYF